LSSIGRLINIILDCAPEDRIDLFKAFPSIYHFFKRRRLHAVIRTIGDVIFSFLILIGLFGPQEPERNCSLYLSWGVWWPSIVLSWFFVGRMWCGFCPFPGVGRLAQKLGLCLDLKIPHSLRKHAAYWSLFLLILIFWIEESTPIKESPRATALLILSILAGATITAMVFPKQTWCRYLCPMGRLIGVASTVSLLEFRPDHDKCRECKTFACKRGIPGQVEGCPVFLGAYNVRNNLECLVCGHCLKACDKGSPQLNIRSPLRELLTNKGRFITCSYIIPFLMGSQLVRFWGQSIWAPPIMLSHEPVALSMGLNLVFMAVGFIYVYAIIRLGAWLFGFTEDELFGKFSPMVPILLPMAFAGELAYRLNYAVANAPDFFPTLARQFGLPSLMSWTFVCPDWIFPLLDSLIICFAVVVSLFVLYRFISGEFHGLVSMWRSWSIAGLIYLMGFSYLVFMLNS